MLTINYCEGTRREVEGSGGGAGGRAEQGQHLEPEGSDHLYWAGLAGC